MAKSPDSATDLQLAEERVAEGERYVQEQQLRVARLEAQGLPTEDAARQLQTFQRWLRQCCRQRDKILTAIEAATLRPPSQDNISHKLESDR